MSELNGDIAIIGGGLSGLATACQIQRLNPDASIQLFESDSRVGGVIHSETRNVPGHGPVLIDHGADMFATKPSAAMDLLDHLNATSRLIEPNVPGRGAMIVHCGKLQPIPEGFVLMRATRLRSMLATPLLSWMGKLRLAKEAVVREPQHDDDESVAQFVRRRLGDEMLQRIVGPLVAGIYTADVERLSMKATMAPLRTMARSHGSLAKATLKRRWSGKEGVESTSSGARYEQFRAFPGGMIELIETLRDALPNDAIHLNCPVEKIERDVTGTRPFRVIFADGTTRSFGQVVLTTPARVSTRLLANLSPAASETLAKIEYASAAIAVLVVKRTNIAMKRPTFGFVVPLMEQRRILAGSFASTKFAGRAPDELTIIRVFLGGMMQSEILEKDDGELTNIAQEELADLIGLSGAPLFSQVVRWNDAMPQYNIGHLERVTQIKNAIAQIPGFHLCSNAFDGVGIAPVIGAALKTATDVVEGTQ